MRPLNYFAHYNAKFILIYNTKSLSQNKGAAVSAGGCG